ncbi:exodeoxyribonuclease V subunit beta [Sodalis-like secondary symbiont of Drepanosiphum platanoidis]|uniref:exodeoxyribonuclease V subunit beta n=1 Tax=Sodalis-like secondary symbiont of Drepanosiphum platanoidis TaxID=2994493 RepID=UPI0034638DF9
MKNSTLLDIINFPITGNSLIEASAGTGKTYIIAALYLRLLLGINIKKKEYVKPLSVKEILVVTFTDMATKELRNRIRENIYNMRIACINKKSNDPLLSSFLSHIKDLNIAKIILLSAERQIDESSIFTIHSFCQRILNQDIIYSGILYKKKILENEYILQKQASEDFWRRYFSNLTTEISSIIYSRWNSPEKLLQDIFLYISDFSLKIKKSFFKKQSITTFYNKIVFKIKKFKKKWNKLNENIQNSLKDCELNKRIYTKKNVLFWIKKISLWSMDKNNNYYIPKELKRFNFNKLKIKNKSNNIFFKKLIKEIENLFKKNMSLYNFIIIKAIYKIRKIILCEKKNNSIIGFDDLLDIFNKLLNINLINSIINRYPIAIIDEFQDTDPKQYKIFKKIYFNKKNCLLLLIGDPKQAIYTFRGADIFNYLKIRNTFKKIYTLEKNWRSSSTMISSINYLFNFIKNPFIFEDIKFIPSKFSKKNINMNFYIKNVAQPSIYFWLKNEFKISNTNYKKFMSSHCAYTINLWLNKSYNNQAFFKKNNKIVLLKSSDITVLVRNKYEANLIYNELLELNIPSIYLSDNTSVFSTDEAKELLLILKASISPEKNNNIKCACATSIIGLNSAQIENINNNEYELEKIKENFSKYYNIWKNYGILSMIKNIITKYNMLNIYIKNNKQKITNFLHLSELLQKKSFLLENKSLLIDWFYEKIKISDNPEDHEKIRLSNDKNLIKIMTIHKSKGLEFPIVFIPFAFDFRKKNNLIFYNRKKYKKQLNLNYFSKNLISSEEERLSEDMRLLYVAITRSIYHCSIGIATIKNKKKIINNDIFNVSALGYILKKNKKNVYDYLYNQLLILQKKTKNNIIVKKVNNIKKNILKIEKKNNHKLFYSKQWIKPNWKKYKIISYSTLQKNNISLKNDIKNFKININNNFKKIKKNDNKISVHTFPKGKHAGIFLHNILEKINFQKTFDKKWLNKKIIENNFNIIWEKLLIKWIKNIINFPIINNFSLSCLKDKQYISELNFYLPINNYIETKSIDLICKKYDKISSKSLLIDSFKITGIFKGFIDLVFLLENKYYIIDYKSNWLGNKDKYYSIKNIKKSIISHRYDIQYNIYTLVLHKYLSNKLKNYNYKKNFGGIIYIFLRGINTKYSKYSVYFHCPNFLLIQELNDLFIK